MLENMEHGQRLKALKTIRVLCVVQCALGLLLLVLAVIARTSHGPFNDGVPPYYTGAFITFLLPQIMAALGMTMYIRGRHCLNKLEASKTVGCLMQGYCMLNIVTIALYVVGMILTGVTGICLTDACSYADDAATNRTLAAIILVFIGLCFVISAISLVVVCKYAPHFGVRLLTRGQFQISDIATPTQDTYEEPVHTVTPVVQLHPEHHHVHHHPDPRLASSPPDFSTHHVHHHPDPRLASPPPDFSTHHLQHYLTQQYKDRIRKRRKRNRRRNREATADTTNGTEGNHNNRESSRRQRERQAPYVLPPVINHSHLPTVPSTKRVAPLPPSQSSPPPPPSIVIYPPPSPPPPPSNTPPSPPNTPPSPPAILSPWPTHPTRGSPPPPLSHWPTHPTRDSPPPPLSPWPTHPTRGSPPPLPWPTHPTRGSPPPPTPSPPGLVHVIPYGGFSSEDEELPPYSP